MSFFVGCVTKYMPGETFFGPPYSVKFADWGYPSWFRFVVGTGELVGGAMLLFPRYRFIGCLLLMCILQGAIVTHTINHDPISESTAAPVVLSLVVIVAAVSSPVGIRQLIPARAG